MVEEGNELQYAIQEMFEKLRESNPFGEALDNIYDKYGNKVDIDSLTKDE